MTAALPPVVEAGTWQRELDALRVREKAATRELDAVAARHGGDDLVENGVDDVFDVALIKMRVLLGDTLNQFRLDHGPAFGRLRKLLWVSEGGPKH